MEETNDIDNQNLINTSNVQVQHEESSTLPLNFHPLAKIKKEALLPSQKIIEHTTIKFLSFNLSLSKPYSDIRLKEFMKLLPKYDIICLQGISSTFTNQQIDLIQEATRNSFFFSVTSEQPSSFSSYTSEYGLIILSRFPIEKYAYIPFKNTCHQEKMIQKGFLYAKVNIKGNSLHIINTSFQSTEYSDKEKEIAGLSNDFYFSRKDSMNNVIAFILEGIFNNKLEYKKGDSVYLVGNMNFDRNGYRNVKTENANFDVFTKEYNEFLTLEPKILIKDIFEKDSKPTYGEYDEDTKRYENVLTFEPFKKSNMILDYAFEVHYKSADSLIEKENSNVFIVKKNSLIVDDFPINISPLSQLSDHSGLSFELEYKESGNLIPIEEESKENFEEIPNELRKIIN